MRSEVAGRAFRAEGIYLDTATYGLPPDTVVDVMADGLDQWARGVARIDTFDAAVARSRELFAELVSIAPEAVAVANQASVHVGAVAAGLPDGAHVVVPSGEFTSLLFPLLVHARRGVTVEEVPLEELADRLHPGVDLVAFSIVQSSDGRLADVDAIAEAARTHDIRTLADGTQAVGWLPVYAGRFDLLVVSAYKWLMCPRGTAFLAVGRAVEDSVLPVNAGWYAGEDVWASIYGGPLRLASSARRFDVSPAWLAWLGSAAALELVTDLGVDVINAHNRALSDQLRRQLKLPPSDSVIVTIPTDGAPDLAAHGVRSAVRAGSVRVGFHLYNDAADVDALVAVLMPN